MGTIFPSTPKINIFLFLNIFGKLFFFSPNKHTCAYSICAYDLFPPFESFACLLIAIRFDLHSVQQFHLHNAFMRRLLKQCTQLMQINFPIRLTA